jgi:hypothetical protein
MKACCLASWIPVTLALFFFGSLVDISSARASESNAGLKNPSVRVLVDSSNTVARTGTMGWGLSMFRIEAGLKVDLALIDERLRCALQAGFARKGHRFVEESPDYTVSYALAIGAEIDEEELNRTYGNLLEIPAGGTNGADNVYYKRGVLIVDVVDRKAKHLMWRGAILAEIDMNWPEKRKQERCDAAVAELMRFFPRPPQ